MARGPSWSARLNRHFAGHTRILGTPDEVVLTHAGAFPVSEVLRARAERLRPPVNEPHGILANRPSWSRRRVDLRYHETDYRVVEALRRQGERPAVLSASALLIAPRERQLILHRRSAMNRYYKRRLHIAGGAFLPSGRSADESLRDTMLREVWEEMRRRPRRGRWPAVMVEEVRTGFVGAIFLGVPTTARPREADEGAMESLSFDALPEDLIRARHWVPAGKLAILAWLALGAPGAPGATFGGRSPAQVLSFALDRSARDYPAP
jgi:hypothetical protein